MEIIDRSAQSLTQGKFAKVDVTTRRSTLIRQDTQGTADPSTAAADAQLGPAGDAPIPTAGTGQVSKPQGATTPNGDHQTQGTAPGANTRAGAGNGPGPAPAAGQTSPTAGPAAGVGAGAGRVIQTGTQIATATARELTSLADASKNSDDLAKHTATGSGSAAAKGTKTAAKKGSSQIRRGGGYISKKLARTQTQRQTQRVARRSARRARKTAQTTTRTSLRVARGITQATTTAVTASGPIGWAIAAIITVAVLLILVFILLIIAGAATTVATNDTANGGAANDLVPAEYQAIVARAGTVCDEVPASLVAGIIEQESNWNQNVVSHAGAVGIAQFMPQWWPEQGKRAANDGKPADINDPQDQIWSLGNNMCENFKLAHSYIDAGSATGTPLEIALAIYNAGQGNVLKYGGVPPFAETQNYVVQVPENAAKYAQAGSFGSGTITAEGTAIVNEARKYLGVPYVWGGETPSGLDCSGLVTIVFRSAGIEVPHHADTAARSSQGRVLSRDEWQPGDVIYIRYPGAYTYHHTAIYAGDGRIVEAVTFGVPLSENSLPSGMDMFAKRYL